METFPTVGKQHTNETLRIAIAHAKENNMALVVASTVGFTAKCAVEMAEQAGILDKLVIVGAAYGSREKGKTPMDEDVAALLNEKAVPIVYASHVLSGAERGLSNKMRGIYPVEIIAHTLRMFGQGVKVCVECAVMALDAGKIEFDCPVVAVGGTATGADCACVLTPAHACNILDCKVHVILCKPY